MDYLGLFETGIIWDYLFWIIWDYLFIVCKEFVVDYLKPWQGLFEILCLWLFGVFEIICFGLFWIVCILFVSYLFGLFEMIWRMDYLLLFVCTWFWLFGVFGVLRLFWIILILCRFRSDAASSCEWMPFVNNRVICIFPFSSQISVCVQLLTPCRFRKSLGGRQKTRDWNRSMKGSLCIDSRQGALAARLTMQY